jgi:transposase
MEGGLITPSALTRSGATRGVTSSTLQQVVELDAQRSEQTPWASTVRTGQQLLKMADGLWTFLDRGNQAHQPAAERELDHSMIQRKISHGDQSASGAVSLSRLLTNTTTLRRQGRDVWQFLEQARIAHLRGV